VPSLAVSVVIPTHDRAALVPRAVASALATLAPGDEVIVSDDGSTDATEEALAPFRDRIRYVRGENAGAGAARNRGLRAATRPLVAFLDSDDEWLPWKTRLQRALHERDPAVLFSFTDFRVRLADGTEHPRYLRRWHEDPRGWDEILGPATPYSALAPLPEGVPDFAVHRGRLYEAQLERSYVATFTTVVRRDAPCEFPEDLPRLHDWEYFARLGKAGTAAHLDVETAVQHGHAGPRLTQMNAYVSAAARLASVARLWGSDAEFLSVPGNRERVERVVRDLRLVRARWLLSEGRGGEAREEMRLAGRAPLSYRALARLPGPALKAVVWARRRWSGAP
jgi:glycosyltransferase involved in cell wall biosynthesis